MSAMFDGTVSRMCTAAGLALAALVLAVGPVLADTEKGHTGQVGVHMLRDSLQKPGVECHYVAKPDPQIGEDLASFTVRAPKVFARIKTGGVDRGKVGWRFMIEQAPGNNSSGPWTAFYTSPVWKRMASDTQFASFSARSASPTIPADDRSFRVKVKMFWYRGDGSTSGTALHLVDYYRTAVYSVVGPVGNCWGHST